VLHTPTHYILHDHMNMNMHTYTHDHSSPTAPCSPGPSSRDTPRPAASSGRCCCRPGRGPRSAPSAGSRCHCHLRFCLYLRCCFPLLSAQRRKRRRRRSQQKSAQAERCCAGGSSQMMTLMRCEIFHIHHVRQQNKCRQFQSISFTTGAS
jgi:hypothetical protein